LAARQPKTFCKKIGGKNERRNYKKENEQVPLVLALERLEGGTMARVNGCDRLAP
jgi:hypothetical protein